MKITIDLRKTPEQNAQVYYEKAKKAKKKLEGARKAIEQTKKKIAALQKQQEEKEAQEKGGAKKADKKWFEKFRWFISSEGFLVVGGRDATSNEIVVKKHTESSDMVFHTDMAGSPFFVIKTQGKAPGDITMQETAQATASFSRAWRAGLSMLEVFHVSPEQVSKTTKAGEYMGKGAFMIYGKTNYISAPIALSIGMTDDGKVMAGPQSAVDKHCRQTLKIVQSKDKTSDTAKKVRKKLGGELDEIVAALPSGGCSIKV